MINEKCCNCGRKAKRYCKLKDDFICYRCCAIVRKEGDCPPECPVLDEKQEYKNDKYTHWLIKALATFSQSEREKFFKDIDLMNHISLFEAYYSKNNLDVSNNTIYDALELGIRYVEVHTKKLIWEPNIVNPNVQTVFNVISNLVDNIDEGKTLLTLTPEKLNNEALLEALKYEQRLCEYFLNHHGSSRSFSDFIKWRINNILKPSEKESSQLRNSSRIIEEARL